jgi:hypothetical protein
MDFIAEIFLGIVMAVLGAVFGLSIQRRRAARSWAKGRLRCAVRLPEAEKKSDRGWRRGVADLGDRQLGVAGIRLHVEAADLPGVSYPEHTQPGGPSALWFDPAIRVIRLQTTDGPVDWAVHESQADAAAERLGFTTASAAG